MTPKQLVREVNARVKYTYLQSPGNRVRVVSARIRHGKFQVQQLHDGCWVTCNPEDVSVER